MTPILNKINKMAPINLEDFNKVVKFYQNSQNQKIKEACKVFFAKHLTALYRKKSQMMVRETDYLSLNANKIQKLGLKPIVLIETYSQEVGLKPLEVSSVKNSLLIRWKLNRSLPL